MVVDLRKDCRPRAFPPLTSKTRDSSAAPPINGAGALAAAMVSHENAVKLSQTTWLDPADSGELLPSSAMRCALRVRSPNCDCARPVARRPFTDPLYQRQNPSRRFPTTRICAFCSWSAPMGVVWCAKRPASEASMRRLSRSATTSAASSTLVSSLSAPPRHSASKRKRGHYRDIPNSIDKLVDES